MSLRAVATAGGGAAPQISPKGGGFAPRGIGAAGGPSPQPAIPKVRHVCIGNCAFYFAEYPVYIQTGAGVTAIASAYFGGPWWLTLATALGTLASACGSCYCVRRFGVLAVMAENVKSAAERVGGAAEDALAAGKDLDKMGSDMAATVGKESEAVADVGTTTAALTARIAELEAEGKSLTTTIAALTADNAKLQSQLGEIQTALGKFKDGLSAFHQENQAAKKDLGDLANALPPLTADTHAIQVAVEHLDTELAKQLQELAGLLATVKADSLAILGSLKEQVVALTEQGKALQAQIGRVGDIEQGLDGDVQRLQALEDRRDAAAADLARLRQDYADLQASMVSVLATMRQEREAGAAAGASQTAASDRMDASVAGTKKAQEALAASVAQVLVVLQQQNTNIEAALAAAPSSQPAAAPGSQPKEGT